MNMIQTITCTVRHARPIETPLTSRGHQIHGFINRAVFSDDQATNLRREHDHDSIKSLSLFMEDGDKWHTTFHTSFMGRNVLSHIDEYLNSLYRQNDLYMGVVSVALDDVNVGQMKPLTTIEALLETPVSPSYCVTMQSPTLIRREHQGRQWFDPHITADKLLRFTFYRWRRLGLPPLDKAFIDALSLVSESRFHVDSEHVQHGDMTLTGAVGDIWIYCARLQPMHQQIAATLLRFAEYAGVGYRVTQGCGWVTVKGIS